MLMIDRRPLALLVLLAPLALSACGGLLPTADCPLDLGYRVTPTSATLAVGQSVTAKGERLECHGTRRSPDEVAWRSADTTIATVDASSGRITAHSVGSTTVGGRSAVYGEVPPITVTVR